MLDYKTQQVLREMADELGMVAGALTTVELPDIDIEVRPETPRLQRWES